MRLAFLDLLNKLMPCFLDYLIGLSLRGSWKIYASHLLPTYGHGEPPEAVGFFAWRRTQKPDPNMEWCSQHSVRLAEKPWLVGARDHADAPNGDSGCLQH